MSEERYADAIGEASLVGPTVRLDLVSVSHTEKDEKGQAKFVFRQRIVMPVEGFVQSFGLLARVMQQLEKQGVIKRPAAEGKDAMEVTPPTSTNFK
jgi:hypothetical protein